MFRSIACKFVALAAAASLAAASIAPVALADLIGTDTVLQLEARQSNADHVERFLARDEVREQLIGLGVDPAAADERVAALTDQELELLAAEIDELPAGGVLAVLGVVLVVLIVLDLLGVTNVFSRL